MQNWAPAVTPIAQAECNPEAAAAGFMLLGIFAAMLGIGWLAYRLIAR